MDAVDMAACFSLGEPSFFSLFYFRTVRIFAQRLQSSALLPATACLRAYCPQGFLYLAAIPCGSLWVERHALPSKYRPMSACIEAPRNPDRYIPYPHLILIQYPISQYLGSAPNIGTSVGP